ISDFVVNTGFHRNLLKRAVAAVVVQEIAFAFEAPGAALHQNALKAAEFVAAELREIVHVEMGIAGHEKIHKAVAVVVAPSRSGHEAAAANSGLFRDVLEFAVAETVVESAATIPGDEKIKVA